MAPIGVQAACHRDGEKGVAAACASLLRRARAAGCDALVVTLDTFTMAWRPLDLDAGYLPFAVGEDNALGFSDGVVVSNHGRRRLDGAVPSLEMLPEMVDAVGDRLTVLFDSDIRTGADALKALALGAKAVLVGRPVIYGLGVVGAEGARHVLAGLLADVDQFMGLAGMQNVAELSRSMLRRINYGGDIKSSV